MTWVGKAVDDPDFYVWCTSPIMGEDDKVHLFCSRWPKGLGMGGWEAHSQVAHYIGDKPQGPFKFADLALKGNPGASWNNTIHNPAIARAGNKYVLLYITLDSNHHTFTCMATSDSLSGPWTLQGTDPDRKGLIIVPSKDPKHWSFGAPAIANPTFLAYGGKYYIYANFSWGGPRHPADTYGYAVADKLEGPYTISDAPCIDNLDYIEDATAFISDGKFHLLMDDNLGSHTGGVWGRGLLWTSDTPTKFRLADAEIGFLLSSDYHHDVSKTRVLYGGGFGFERPGILMIKGHPAYFYAPCGNNIDGEDHTCSYVLKIDLKNPNPLLKAIYAQPTTPEVGTWIKAADVSTMSGPRFLDNSRETIGFCNSGGNFMFGPYHLAADSISGMEVIVGVQVTGGQMHVRLDGAQGPTIGTFSLQSTGGLDVFKSQSTALKYPGGDHQLYFHFEGAAKICNFKEFRFTKEQSK
jgi:hypothetical protein